MSEQKLEEIRQELAKSNKDTVERRSILNPIYWIGLSFFITGFLLCVTIIGFPVGILMLRGGKSWMYKNYDKNKGL